MQLVSIDGSRADEGTDEDDGWKNNEGELKDGKKVIDAWIGKLNIFGL